MVMHMGGHKSILISAAFAASVAIAPASAQPIPPPPANNTLDLPDLNFDMWCQEEAHLPPARCDKRLPRDEAVFDSYRHKVEQYDVPEAVRRQNEQNLNREILHSDPVENPIDHPLQQPAPGP